MSLGKENFDEVCPAVGLITIDTNLSPPPSSLSRIGVDFFNLVAVPRFERMIMKKQGKGM